MKATVSLQDSVTIVVNSCDSYEDLWVPFFTLLKKYWDPVGIRILLNTETKDFAFEGLKIECVHSSGETKYGQRMINVLKQVKTKYVIPLLDDFFIRSAVDEKKIEQIICWMEADLDIVYFNCDPNKVYVDWETNRYPGFRRLPPGNDYVLSMQAAVWRTKDLLRYWQPDVNPWEWEVLSNAATAKQNRKKFYCLADISNTFLDYGFNYYGMGVYRGKWVIDDVGPLFKKENICVDFSIRGIYDSSMSKIIIEQTSDVWAEYDRVARCLGKGAVWKYFLFRRYCQVLKLFGVCIEGDYFQYLTVRARNRFLKTHNLDVKETEGSNA